MTSTYRAVMLTRNDVLETVELPIQAPGPGQIRVRVRAAGVGSTDLMMLAGIYRYAPKMPFVPGYEIAGVSDRDAAAVVLNFVTADQAIDRVGKPRPVRPRSSPARPAASESRCCSSFASPV